MRATKVLQKCLSVSLGAMHSMRVKTLLNAVEALLQGRRLTLTDVARSWPDAMRVRAPLKAMDRLLSNRHLHGEREGVYGDMARLKISPDPASVYRAAMVSAKVFALFQKGDEEGARQYFNEECKKWGGGDAMVCANDLVVEAL